jgi:hypothetical protein
MPVEIPKHILTTDAKICVDMMAKGTPVERLDAAHTFWRTAQNAKDYQRAAMGTHGIGSLLEMVTEGADPKAYKDKVKAGQCLHAIRAILHLGINDENKVTFATAGAIQPLITLITENCPNGKTEEHKEAAREALKILGGNADVKKKIVQAGYQL